MFDKRGALCFTLIKHMLYNDSNNIYMIDEIYDSIGSGYD